MVHMRIIECNSPEPQEVDPGRDPQKVTSILQMQLSDNGGEEHSLRVCVCVCASANCNKRTNRDTDPNVQGYLSAGWTKAGGQGEQRRKADGSVLSC